jgi:hypothetical protein
VSKQVYDDMAHHIESAKVVLGIALEGGPNIGHNASRAFTVNHGRKLIGEIERLRAIEEAAKALGWDDILNGIGWGIDQSTSAKTRDSWEAVESRVTEFMALLGVRDTRLD